MALIGYARVSTTDQDPALQVAALEAEGCERIIVEQASGALKVRPQLDAALAYLRPGDCLVVWRLDRLGRSMKHLIETVAELDDRTIGFKSISESMDTSTSGGRLVFHIFGALAEFERALIRERTVAGLTAARARGRSGGRKSLMTPAKTKVAQRMYEEEEPIAHIAQALGVSRATVYRALSAAKRNTSVA